MVAPQSSVCVYNLNHRVRYPVKDQERGGGLLICQTETLSCSQLTWAQVSPALQTDFLFGLEWVSLPTSGLCRGEPSFFLLATSVLTSPLHIWAVSSVTRWISKHLFQCFVPCRLNGRLLLSGFLAEQMWANQPQAMGPTRAPRGRLQRNRDAVAWPFSRLWRVSDPTLFQMTIIAALWVAVFGE